MKKDNRQKKSADNIIIEVLRAVISALSMIALAFLLYYAEAPNIDMIMMTGLMIFTSLFGYVSGIVCSVILILNSLFFSEACHSVFQLDIHGFLNLGIVISAAVLNVAFIGYLKKKQSNFQERLTKKNEALKKSCDELQKISTTDHLTKVKNRTALDNDLYNYENRSLHVMMLDIDNFKNANDVYGHEAGDKVLSFVGNAISGTFGADGCYRYGGDEFLIICVGMKETHFAAKTEKFKETVAGHKMDIDGFEIHISAGYVYGDSDLPIDISLMIRQADSNLYKAKKNGKDMIVSCEYSRREAEKIKTFKKDI